MRSTRIVIFFLLFYVLSVSGMMSSIGEDDKTTNSTNEDDNTTSSIIKNDEMILPKKKDGEMYRKKIENGKMHSMKKLKLHEDIWKMIFKFLGIYEFIELLNANKFFEEKTEKYLKLFVDDRQVPVFVDIYQALAFLDDCEVPEKILDTLWDRTNEEQQKDSPLMIQLPKYSEDHINYITCTYDPKKKKLVLKGYFDIYDIYLSIFHQFLVQDNISDFERVPSYIFSFQDIYEKSKQSFSITFEKNNKFFKWISHISKDKDMYINGELYIYNNLESMKKNKYVSLMNCNIKRTNILITVYECIFSEEKKSKKEKNLMKKKKTKSTLQKLMKPQENKNSQISNNEQKLLFHKIRLWTKKIYSFLFSFFKLFLFFFKVLFYVILIQKDNKKTKLDKNNF